MAAEQPKVPDSRADAPDAVLDAEKRAADRGIDPDNHVQVAALTSKADVKAAEDVAVARRNMVRGSDLDADKVQEVLDAVNLLTRVLVGTPFLPQLNRELMSEQNRWDLEHLRASLVAAQTGSPTVLVGPSSAPSVRVLSTPSHGVRDDV